MLGLCNGSHPHTVFDCSVLDREGTTPAWPHFPSKPAPWEFFHVKPRGWHGEPTPPPTPPRTSNSRADRLESRSHGAKLRSPQSSGNRTVLKPNPRPGHGKPMMLPSLASLWTDAPVEPFSATQGAAVRHRPPGRITGRLPPTSVASLLLTPPLESPDLNLLGVSRRNCYFPAKT